MTGEAGSCTQSKIYLDQSPPTKRLRRTLDNSQSEEDYIIDVSSHSTETGPAINTIASSGQGRRQNLRDP
ncbi:hypothetical protein LOD99_11271 [Oopsacas minuta]|uniref:Uncharacterized protein n=1 Tax=Oopsacas minuta TaxID=111878 RepID=A0AAV7K668_9METZ|nr:hypothetical protein LOD99_11271 [Oopsacas minuta]